MSRFPIRKDAARIIGVVLAVVAFAFSFVCLTLNEYGPRIEIFPALMPGLSGSGMEDYASLLASLLLLVGMTALHRKPQCLLVVSALALYILSFCIYALSYSDSMLELLSSLLQPSFIVLIMPFALSLAGAIWALSQDEDKSSALLVLALVLTAVALLSMFMEVLPFGADFGNTRFLSTFFRYSATWLCVPFAFADMAANAKDGKDHAAPLRSEARRDSGNQEANLRSSTETVKALKELLDMGAITAEEYEEKKKELLRL